MISFHRGLFQHLITRLFIFLIVFFLLPTPVMGEGPVPTASSNTGRETPSIIYDLPISSRAVGVKQTRVLNAAFSLLEEGNVFLKKYQEMTGSDIKAAYPLGLPYFFGGRDEALLYKIMEAWQNSGHFKKGRSYVYGYDCIGFTRHVYQKAGLNHPATIPDMFTLPEYEVSRIDVMSHPYPEWRNLLNVGELLILKGKVYHHVMIFIGTLRDYGFTQEELGETLFRYRDFPLFIHCADNPWAITRNRKHIESLKRTLPIYDTDGGVHVALVGVPPVQAPYTVQVGNVKVHAFELMGAYLPLYDLSEKSSVLGWRLPDSPAALLPVPEPAPLSQENEDAYVELREGVKHPLVKKVKQRLYDLGYYRNNVVNDLYTADTANFIRLVQRTNLLKETGVATAEFLEFFFSDSVTPFHTPKP